MRTILVSLDISGRSAPTVDELAELLAPLAEAVPARIWLVHVVDPDVGPEDRLEFVAQDIRDYLADQLRKERGTLRNYARHLASLGIDARPLLVRGRPADTIVEEVKHRHADLLVMGWPRHGPFYRSLLGSITDSVIRDCPCPVLVMPLVARKAFAANHPRPRLEKEPSSPH